MLIDRQPGSTTLTAQFARVPVSVRKSDAAVAQRNENITPTSGAQSVAFEVNPNELFSLT